MEFKTYFGKVVDVQDEEHRYRIRVTIQGFTDNIDTKLLPWYYPFFGIHHIPVKDDELLIFIFEDNFEMGFYGPKIPKEDNGYKDSEYENYLEIYNRLKVFLGYTESDGIKFINDKSFIQIEKEKFTVNTDNKTSTFAKDKIEIGDKNTEPTPLGDKTVDAFLDVIDEDDKGFQKCMQLFNAIASAASTPSTAPIKAAIMGLLPGLKSAQSGIVNKNKQSVKKIRSKLVFIE